MQCNSGIVGAYLLDSGLNKASLAFPGMAAALLAILMGTLANWEMQKVKQIAISADIINTQSINVEGFLDDASDSGDVHDQPFCLQGTCIYPQGRCLPQMLAAAFVEPSLLQQHLYNNK